MSDLVQQIIAAQEETMGELGLLVAPIYDDVRTIMAMYDDDGFLNVPASMPIVTLDIFGDSSARGFYQPNALMAHVPQIVLNAEWAIKVTYSAILKTLIHEMIHHRMYEIGLDSWADHNSLFEVSLNRMVEEANKTMVNVDGRKCIKQISEYLCSVE